MRRIPFTAILLAGTTLLTASCGGGDDEGSPGGETNATEIVEAIVDRHGEEVAFEAVAYALERGHTIDAVEAAALAGVLEPDGTILDDDGTVVAPERPRIGRLLLPGDDEGDAAAGPDDRAPVLISLTYGDDQSEHLPVTNFRQLMEGTADLAHERFEAVTGEETTDFVAGSLLVTLVSLARSGYDLDQIIDLLLLGDDFGVIVGERGTFNCYLLFEPTDDGFAPVVPAQSSTQACREFQETETASFVGESPDTSDPGTGASEPPAPGQTRAFRGEGTVSYTFPDDAVPGCTIDLTVDIEVLLQPDFTATLRFENWPLSRGLRDKSECYAKDEPRIYAGGWSMVGPAAEASIAFAQTGQSIPIEVLDGVASTTTLLTNQRAEYYIDFRLPEISG